MKFKDISERVKGGKLDPLSKMGKSKLTGQEVARYYRENPKAKQAAKNPDIKKAIELALDLGGNYTLAYKEIQKINRNLPRHPEVKKALQTANEDMTSTTSVAMPEIPLGRKHKVMKRKDLEEETLVENKVRYQTDFGKDRMGVTATAFAEYTKHIAKKFKIKIVKTPNPKSQNHLTFEAPEKDMKKFQQFLKKNLVKNAVPYIQKKNAGKLDEASMTYRIRKAQKPEIDNMMKGARMMKLKVTGNRVKTAGADPKRKTGDTEITVSGPAKNLRDFDAVVRGKSSYGDPSVVEDAVERAKEMADLKAKHKREVEQEKDEIERTKDTANAESVLAQLDALEEQLDLLEKQYAVKGAGDEFSKRNRLRRTKSSSGDYLSKDDLVAKLRKLPDGSNKVKDSNNSLIVRSLARLMNTERRPAAKKGVAFGKGKGPDEMDAPKIKKIIDIVSKGISITKTGDKMMRNKKELDAFSDLDTYTRDEVEGIISKTSDGTLSRLAYESTEFNEESAVMKKVRQVVKKKSMMNIDGMKLDLTTASMISSVYDQVNPQNKKKMDKLKLPQLINLTMKVAGKSRKESTDLQEVTRQEVDAMKKVSKDMQKVLQTYQKIATIGDKELKDTRHNKDYKKVLDARDSILKMIGTLNTKMLMQKETVSEANQPKKFQMTFTDKQPKSLDHFLRMIKTQEKATAKAGLTTIKLLKKTKKGKNTVVDFMAGPNMQIDSIKRIMTNVKKKFKEGLEEAVSPAQQAAIAISKKERGEKPKNECADEKDFKPHKMYKGDKEVMANTYADHMKLGKMGYTHEKPKSEALDAKDKPFVKDLVKKLRGGSKTHAKQADDLEKAINTESMSRARADAMRDMDRPKDRGDDDGYGVATKDDRKAADKNVVMQIRRVTDLSKPAQIELRNGKKVMLKPADAKMMMKKFDAIRKPQDRLKVQTAMNDKKMTVQGLKRLLGR